MGIYQHHCPKCDFPLTLQDRFCGACGEQVTRPCPHCNHDAQLTSTYCNYCGTPLIPLDGGEKMTTRERIAFYREREDKAFTVKQKMCQAELAVNRKRYQRLRLIEIAALGFISVLILLFLQPYLQEK
jgi:hypothetical protein